jgi:hypothetical protein
MLSTFQKYWTEKIVNNFSMSHKWKKVWWVGVDREDELWWVRSFNVYKIQETHLPYSMAHFVFCRRLQNIRYGPGFEQKTCKNKPILQLL